MTKHHIPAVHEAGGDLAKHEEALKNAVENIKEGHSTLVAFHDYKANDGSGDTLYVARVHHK